MKLGIYYHPKSLVMIEVFKKSIFLSGFYRIIFFKNDKPMLTITRGKVLKDANFIFLGEV